jgi:hypothetical protein
MSEELNQKPNQKPNQKHHTRTIVFTGPSLSPEMAKKILPHAWIHAPAKCGDILKVIRLSPQRIAIIDGYFEQTASLWHKEILFALSLGIEVYGASSMGALRAIELEPYGMKGIGKIFELLKKNQSTDDDEVCLAHTEDFSHQTPPMCNIRATLDQAVFHHQLNETEKNSYLERIKALPYYERSFSELSGETRLINFCIQNYVDQKKEDAIALLNYLKHTPFTPPQHIQPFVPTLFFYKIFREMSATPFDQEYPWLPKIEKVAVIKSQQPGFSAHKRLTKLFHLCYDLAQQQSPMAPDSKQVMPWIDTLQKKHPIPLSDQALQEYLELYDPGYLSAAETLPLTLKLFRGLLAKLIQMDFHLYASHYQNFSNYFRKKNELLNEADTLKWLENKGLRHLKTSEDGSAEPLAEFNLFVEYITPLHHLIDLNNSHQLGIPPSLAAICWLKFSTLSDPCLDLGDVDDLEDLQLHTEPNSDTPDAS